jgi:uncharacterized protein
MKRFACIAALAAVSCSAAAQEAMIVSTGSPTGTYSSMFKSIQMLCGDKVALQELNSTGSDENIDNLINKKADLAFVQTDALQMTANNDPRAGEANIRTLVPLHNEEVHPIALKDLSRVSGGLSFGGKNFFGSKQELTSLADLNGIKVGAWGGSYTTARAIAILGGVQYEPVQFPNEAQALAALDKGQIGAIIAVGGQPLGFVQKLGPGYKLLRIDSGLAAKVKAYTPARVSYRNIGASGVETIAARAYLVTKNYTTPERRARLSALKQCILDNEGNFKEGTGHHPKWADVDLKAPTVWANYETTPAIAQAPAAKRR